MQEAGVAGYDASVWLGLLAPAGTPPAIISKLNSEVAKIMAAPDSQKALFDAGVEVSLSSPDALAKLMADDLVRWSKLIKEIGIELE
jgi:tripartite-type tricarboxylate transporter receptor subunit TctC